MKTLSPLRRLLVVLAVLLPAALVAPGTAVAACNVPADELQCPDFAVPEDGTAKTNQEITFAVIDPSPDVTYLWDTNDDGTFGTSASATYTDPGDKKVTLRAVLNADPTKVNETTKGFTVTAPEPPPPVNKAPVADFSVRGTRVVGQPITLTSTSTDSDGTIVNFEWTADGGAPVFDGQGTSTTVTFGQAGTYRVTLKVTDNQGAQASRTRRIVVSSAPPPPNQLPNIPAFTFNPERPSAGEVVRFTATASDPDGTIENIEWDFDNDGAVDASGASVQRVFTEGGTATVVVIVTDDRGGQRKSFQTFTVTGASRTGTATSQGNTTNAQTGQNVGTVGVGNTPNNTGSNNTTLRRINAIIRLRGSFVGSQTRITLLQVSGVPRGAKVRARCRGGGCPKGLVTSTAQTSGRTIRLRTFERRLSVGARIEVFVTRTGRLGKYTRWTIKRGKAPLRLDKCVRSFGGKTSTCPNED